MRFRYGASCQVVAERLLYLPQGPCGSRFSCAEERVEYMIGQLFALPSAPNESASDIVPGIQSDLLYCLPMETPPVVPPTQFIKSGPPLTCTTQFPTDFKLPKSGIDFLSREMDLDVSDSTLEVLCSRSLADIVRKNSPPPNLRQPLTPDDVWCQDMPPVIAVTPDTQPHDPEHLLLQPGVATEQSTLMLYQPPRLMRLQQIEIGFPPLSVSYYDAVATPLHISQDQKDQGDSIALLSEIEQSTFFCGDGPLEQSIRHPCCFDPITCAALSCLGKQSLHQAALTHENGLCDAIRLDLGSLVKLAVPRNENIVEPLEEVLPAAPQLAEAFWGMDSAAGISFCAPLKTGGPHVRKVCFLCSPQIDVPPLTLRRDFLSIMETVPVQKTTDSSSFFEWCNEAAGCFSLLQGPPSPGTDYEVGALKCAAGHLGISHPYALKPVLYATEEERSSTPRDLDGDAQHNNEEEIEVSESNAFRTLALERDLRLALSDHYSLWDHDATTLLRDDILFHYSLLSDFKTLSISTEETQLCLLFSTLSNDLNAFAELREEPRSSRLSTWSPVDVNAVACAALRGNNTIVLLHPSITDFLAFMVKTIEEIATKFSNNRCTFLVVCPEQKKINSVRGYVESCHLHDPNAVDWRFIDGCHSPHNCNARVLVDVVALDHVTDEVLNRLHTSVVVLLPQCEEHFKRFALSAAATVLFSTDTIRLPKLPGSVLRRTAAIKIAVPCLHVEMCAVELHSFARRLLHVHTPEMLRLQRHVISYVQQIGLEYSSYLPVFESAANAEVLHASLGTLGLSLEASARRQPGTRCAALAMQVLPYISALRILIDFERHVRSCGLQCGVKFWSSFSCPPLLRNIADDCFKTATSERSAAFAEPPTPGTKEHFLNKLASSHASSHVVVVVLPHTPAMQSLCSTLSQLFPNVLVMLPEELPTALQKFNGTESVEVVVWNTLCGDYDAWLFYDIFPSAFLENWGADTALHVNCFVEGSSDVDVCADAETCEQHVMVPATCLRNVSEEEESQCSNQRAQCSRENPTQGAEPVQGVEKKDPTPSIEFFASNAPADGVEFSLSHTEPQEQEARQQQEQEHSAAPPATPEKEEENTSTCTSLVRPLPTAVVTSWPSQDNDDCRSTDGRAIVVTEHMLDRHELLQAIATLGVAVVERPVLAACPVSCILSHSCALSFWGAADWQSGFAGALIASIPFLQRHFARLVIVIEAETLGPCDLPSLSNDLAACVEYSMCSFHWTFTSCERIEVVKTELAAEAEMNPILTSETARLLYKPQLLFASFPLCTVLDGDRIPADVSVLDLLTSDKLIDAHIPQLASTIKSNFSAQGAESG